MAEELQSLLEKIQRDGVEKANAEAAKIIADAKAEAQRLVKTAQESADAARAAAEADAQASAARAAETIRQAARDVVLGVEGAVTKLFENVLAKNVDAALADPAVLSGLAAEAVQALARDVPAEVAASARFAGALRAALAADARQGLTVVTDEALGTGFAVRLDGGRVAHDFTAPVISAALAQRLRPELAKIVKGDA